MIPTGDAMGAQLMARQGHLKFPVPVGDRPIAPRREGSTPSAPAYPGPRRTRRWEP